MTSRVVSRGTRRAAPGGLIMLGVVVVGVFMLGRTTAPDSQPTWESGRTDVVGQKVTIETGSWTYGFEGPIGWVDSADRPSRSFPECLTSGTEVDVRFAWVWVPDLGTREVVAIGC